jgi:mRNA-degrading endonuclease RelE of RelBE toxin-antitoxin system
MADPREKPAGEKTVRFSNTATTMLSALSTGKKKDVLATIATDIADPAKVRKIQGYEDVYVARGNGLRVIFKRKNGTSEVTSVAVEAG